MKSDQCLIFSFAFLFIRTDCSTVTTSSTPEVPSEPTTTTNSNGFAMPSHEFTTETHFEDSDAIEFEQQKNASDADATSNHHSRRKRQILVPVNHITDNNAYTMEVLVAVDRKMQEYHGKNIKAYVLTLMSIVSSIYADASIGNSINVAVVHILLLKDDLRVESNHIGELSKPHTRYSVATTFVRHALRSACARAERGETKTNGAGMRTECIVVNKINFNGNRFWNDKMHDKFVTSWSMHTISDGVVNGKWITSHLFVTVE